MAIDAGASYPSYLGERSSSMKWVEKFSIHQTLNGGQGGIDYALLRLCGMRFANEMIFSLRAKWAVKPWFLRCAAAGVLIPP
ncbi:MAG: hypothetical protein ABJQ29_16495 [Luteolibacter sp.]